LWIYIEECVLILLVDWNHIDEDDHVVRVDRGLYDYATGITDWTISHGLIVSHECDVLMIM